MYSNICPTQNRPVPSRAYRHLAVRLLSLTGAAAESVLNPAPDTSATASINGRVAKVVRCLSAVLTVDGRVGILDECVLQTRSCRPTQRAGSRESASIHCASSPSTQCLRTKKQSSSSHEGGFRFRQQLNVGNKMHCFLRRQCLCSPREIHIGTAIASRGS